MSKHAVSAIALLLLAAYPVLAAPDSQASFAGRWEGSFKGTVFCVLTIQAGGTISGTLSPGDVTADDDGVITDAKPSTPDGTFPILNPKVDGKTLHFEWKESSDDQALQFEFKLTGDKEGELRMVSSEGIKPILLRRAD